jgi:hypothetical protein
MIPDRQIPDEVLPGCTAKVMIGGTHEGSAFFVARGLAVTCFHVIDPAELTSGDSAAELTLVDPQGNEYDVTEIARHWKDVDLAVMRLSPTDHPCVLLDGGFRSQDPLYTYGYSDRLPGGAGTMLEGESWIATDEVLLKLRDGQVRPGMSGSPVLNERTGAVCGIVQRTRDDTQSLGGYAISAKELLRRYPKLLSKNRRFHLENPRWGDVLGPKLRRAVMNSGRREQAAMSQLLMIGVRQDADGWWVDATVYPDEERLDSVQVDLNSVRREVARLFRDWALRGRVRAQEQVRLLGGILSTAILPGQIGERFESLLKEADRQNQLLVALRFNEEADSELMYLPWEHLYARQGQGRDVFFARDQRLGFVRAAEAEPLEELRGRAAASVLIVDTAPVEHVEMEPKDRKLMQDIQRVAEAAIEEIVKVAKFRDPGRLSSPDPAALRETVEDGEYDVVHYVGYGQFRLGGGGDALALGDGEGGVGFVDADVLAGSLASERVRLVVLQLCSDSEAEVVPPPDFSELAPSLIGRDIPAVIACQSPMRPNRAIDFNKTLYAELANGATVAVAVQEARQSASLDVDDARSFVSPALFVRHAGPIRLIETGRGQGSPGASVVGANA